MVRVECTTNGKVAASSEVLAIVTLNSGRSIHTGNDEVVSCNTLWKYSGWSLATAAWH